MATTDLRRPPPITKLFAAECNASDPLQQWGGATFSTGGASAVRNVGTGLCLGPSRLGQKHHLDRATFRVPSPTLLAP